MLDLQLHPHSHTRLFRSQLVPAAEDSTPCSAMTFVLLFDVEKVGEGEVEVEGVVIVIAVVFGFGVRWRTSLMRGGWV